MFAIAEGVRGRTVRREIYEKVSVVGLCIVLLLFFLVGRGFVKGIASGGVKG